MIYITEAHAMDVWPIGMSAGTINYSHKTIEDRKMYAEKFIKTFNFKVPIFLDSMDNSFESEFASWPFRYYIIKDKKFSFIADPEDSFFDITEMFRELENL